MTLQVPMPLVMVKFAPTFVHEPDELYDTARPDVAEAATVKLAPLTALRGALVLMVIV